MRWTTALKEFDAGKALFLRTHAKGAYSRSDVSVPGEDVGTLGAKVNTYLWALNADLGLLWPINENTSISPSIGVGYMGAYSPSTKTNMSGDNGLQGYINNYSNMEHLFEGTTSLKLLHRLTPKMRVALEGGLNYNFNPTIDGKAALHLSVTDPTTGVTTPSKTTDTYSFTMGKLRGYAQTGVIIEAAPKLDLSFNYNGTFANNTTAHTGFLQFNWWWN